MKKILVALLLCATISILPACSNNVSQEEYQSLEDSLSQLQFQHDQTLSNYDSLKKEFASLQEEYKSYKEKMEVYETLEASEAEARQIEADRIIAEQQAAEEAAAAEESAALAAEEAKGYETGISYDNIARNPDEYEGKKVKFTGEVIQLIENDDTIQIRFAIDKDYDQIIFCEYSPSIVDSRILEDDVITIYGVSAGTISYESTLGAKITIPAVSIDRIDQ